MKSILPTNFYEVLVKNLKGCKQLHQQFQIEGDLEQTQYYLGCVETIEMLIDGYKLFNQNKFN
jgi:hypothetical protein